MAKVDNSDRTIITHATTIDSKKEVSPNDACLIVIFGAEIGRKFLLGTEESIAGRTPTNAIPIEQDAASRKNTRFAWTGSAYEIEDLGSTNGTWVNGIRIKDKRHLVDGDQIKIGETLLKFVASGNAESNYHEEIYRLMTFDGLTQTYNKRYFQEAIDREISRSRRYARELSLILFDIDHFKKKNDTFGHLAGDAVLREMSAIIRTKIRREDIFARVGGEEFALLVPELDLDKAQAAAERIRKIIEQSRFAYEDKEIPTTISLGVAKWWSPDEASEALYKRADAALYTAKQSGRNRVVCG